MDVLPKPQDAHRQRHRPLPSEAPPPHPTCERQFVSSGADIRVLRFGRQLELSDEAVHRLFSVAPAAACLLGLLLGLLLLVM